MCSLLPATLRTSSQRLLLARVSGCGESSVSDQPRRGYVTPVHDFADIISFSKLRRMKRGKDNSFSISRYDDAVNWRDVHWTSRHPNLLYSDSIVRPRSADLYFVEMGRKVGAFLQWLKVKFIVTALEDQLPSANDVVNGSKEVHKQCLQALLNSTDMNKLASHVLGGSATLQKIRDIRLSPEQKKALKSFSEDDFVGLDGCMCNWNGFNLDLGHVSRYLHFPTIVQEDATGARTDVPYLKYSVFLASVLKKKQLYELVRAFPWNSNIEQMRLKVPATYGFNQPRYCFMRIDMCHKAGIGTQLTIEEDALLYDFHVNVL